MKYASHAASRPRFYVGERRRRTTSSAVVGLALIAVSAVATVVLGALLALATAPSMAEAPAWVPRAQAGAEPAPVLIYGAVRAYPEWHTLDDEYHATSGIDAVWCPDDGRLRVTVDPAAKIGTVVAIPDETLAPYLLTSGGSVGVPDPEMRHTSIFIFRSLTGALVRCDSPVFDKHGANLWMMGAFPGLPAAPPASPSPDPTMMRTAVQR